MRNLQIQRVLGSGAFAAVYLADLIADRNFRRTVAVKVLLAGQQEEFVARVRDEARLLGLLQDEHILKVLELVHVDGRDSVLMEYVEGVDLGALIEGGQRPPPRALAEIGAVMAGTLHRAHHAVHPASGEPLNVIHRDVKPSNLMISQGGMVKLLDFGVARAKFAARESVTGQFVLGTLNYMAPEYVVTGEVSPEADIYAIGLTLWEAIMGEVFGQPKLRQDQHEARVHERLGLLPMEFRWLVPILQRVLTWRPQDRMTGAELERSLMSFADRLPGQGLRGWAMQAVPPVLAARAATAKDLCGLLGKTVPIEEERIVDAPVDATMMNVARPAFLDTLSPPVAASTPASSPAAAPPPSAPLPPPPRPPRPATSPLMLIFQGLLIGGFLGLLLLLVVAAFLLTKLL